MATAFGVGLISIFVAGCISLFGWPLDPWRSARVTYMVLLTLVVVVMEADSR